MRSLFHLPVMAVLFAMAPVSTGCSQCTRDLSRYDVLKNPRISQKPKQKMIVVELKGDPNEVGGKAFKKLFKTYWGLKKKVKGLENAAPLARWPSALDTPKDKWIGIYGLPVPDEVEELPESDGEGPEVRLEHWEYGETAEILHVGPYSGETPTIEKLHAFIEERGYEIAGPHEEEYIKGPGMFFNGNPDKYKTIIRYPVKKK